MLSKAGAHVPLIPLVEVVGNGASGSPEHIAATGLNVGVINGLTVIVSVVVTAHCPAAGVNVYVVVTVLSKAGAHIPLIPLVEVVGKGASGSPEHIAATALNVGVMSGLTVTVKVVVVAHCPALGVKVYVPVAVLLTAGAHVPAIPLVDVVGNTGAAEPLHIAATGLNVGVTFGVTVTVNVVVVAHCPTPGVKV